MKKIFALILASLLAASSFGEITLPKLFSDNVVLQRSKPLKFWGKASPNAEVVVELVGVKKSAKADSNGDWSLDFPPQNCTKNPTQLLVYENGNLSKTVKNVLIGEVWILGGQSNMSWPISYTTEWKKMLGRIGDFSKIRCFKNSELGLPSHLKKVGMGDFERSTVQSRHIARTPQKDYPDGYSWEVPTPNGMKLWSAIGLHFADELSKRLDVPVGVILTSIGGSAMHTWIPQKDMDKIPFLKNTWDSFEKQLPAWDNGGYDAVVDDYHKRMSSSLVKNGGRPKGSNSGYFMHPSKASPLHPSKTPCGNFNAKIYPLKDFSVAGVLWYQGEADVLGESAKVFEEQFLLVVKTWRELFGEIPFIQAQLSSFGYGQKWPSVRAAQLKAALENKSVYAVCTIDGGEEKNVHPNAKKLVADRMIRTAFGEIYGGEKDGAFSPNMKKVQYDGAKAEVLCELYGSSLEIRGEARGFYVLTKGKWSPADVEIKKGTSLILKSRDGARIDGVYYLWKAYPQDEVCVYNKQGLPLFPFRNLRK